VGDAPAKLHRKDLIFFTSLALRQRSFMSADQIEIYP
jgi:hypothetical protein